MIKNKKIIIGILLVLAVVTACFLGGEQSPEKQAELNPEKPALELTEVLEQDAEITEPVEQEKNVEEPKVPEPTQDTNEIDAPIREENEKKLTCILTVRCDAILENLDKLKKGKESVLPSNGVIYPEQSMIFTQGESVFDVLYRALRTSGIHFEFQQTPMYDSVYIEGIGNLYEFDCGDYSGWLYQVNGEIPNHGCSQHQVKDGDSIVFYYHCG